MYLFVYLLKFSYALFKKKIQNSKEHHLFEIEILCNNNVKNKKNTVTIDTFNVSLIKSVYIWQIFSHVLASLLLTIMQYFQSFKI